MTPGLIAKPLQLPIRFEDQHLLVVEKPSGLLSQGEITGSENLVDWCRAHFGRNYVGLVHRLDRNTSGLMVVAKRSKAADRLTTAIQTKKLIRRYQAWVIGKLSEPAQWTHFLKKDEEKNHMAWSNDPRPGYIDARLSVRPVRTQETAGHILTLAEFQLDTGRSHQIRVQSAAKKHPLVGDIKYGGPAAERLYLHSCFLSFDHPMTKETMTFESPFLETPKI